MLIIFFYCITLIYYNIGKDEEVIELIKNGNVRINCLEKNGMNLLDQACFKGNERLTELLIESGINIDNRAHEQGYTCLMFAALAGIFIIIFTLFFLNNFMKCVYL